MHLADFLWTLLVIFFMVIFFMMLFRIIMDVFRNHDSSGWVKAGWLIFLLVAPIIGMLVYVIVNGKHMAERDVKDMQRFQQAQDDYIKSLAGSGDATSQISQAHDLLEKGAISQAEFDSIKAKALAS